MKYLSIIFDILILCFGIKFIIKRYQYKKRIDIFFITNAALCLYYAFVPLLIKIFNYEYSTNYMRSLKYVDDYRYFFTSLMCFMLYMLFLVVNRKLPSKTVDVIEKNQDDKDIHIVNRNYKIYSTFAYICFIIGALAFLIVSYSAGGVRQLLRMGDITRAYGQDVGMYINRRLLPLRTLMPIILASPFLFYIMGEYKKTFLNKVMFILSFVISVLFLIFNAGRAPLLTFILPFIITKIFRKHKHPWRATVLMCLILLPMLQWLDDLFFYLSYGHIITSTNDLNLIQYFIEQFGYPYVNMLNANKIIDYIGLRLGIDYITWIINIIPVSILSKFGLWKVNHINDYITLYYSDIKDILKITGGVPIDIFTLGYLQLGFVGAIILVLFFSLIIKKLDKRSYLDRNYKFTKLLYLRVGFNMFFLIPNASFESIVRGRMDIILLIIIIILTTKHTIKAKPKENIISKIGVNKKTI